jgi:hypothetical protein
MTFEALFRSANPNNRVRDKFLSRVFGIFNEEIVRCWVKDSNSPYEDLGRPTISGGNKPCTLDFTFRSKHDGLIYIVEMKCELEYENYRYLTLESSYQLDHHKKDAFRTFLDVARNNGQLKVKIKGKPQEEIHGAILIWGRCTQEGRDSVKNEHKLAEVLSLEEIISDLVAWGNQDYIELLADRERWCGDLFTGLRSIAKTSE